MGVTVTGLLGGRDRSTSGRTGYLLAAALGVLLASRRTGANSINLAPIGEALASAVGEARAPAKLPTATAPRLTGELDLAPDDPPLNALLNATLREIGSQGFEGASVDRIAKASQHTKGLVFSRFPSKVGLFLEATRRQQTAAFEATEAVMTHVAQSRGRGVAEAVAIREMQRPQTASARSILMEQLRMSWHNREVKSAHDADLDAMVATLSATNPEHAAHESAAMHFGYAVGLGVAVLPLLYPAAWGLPYDVMTIPLVDMGL